MYALITSIEGEISLSKHTSIAEAEAEIRNVWDEETHGVKTAGLSGDDLLDAVYSAYLPGHFGIEIVEL